jgi:DNA polymerase
VSAAEVRAALAAANRPRPTAAAAEHTAPRGPAKAVTTSVKVTQDAVLPLGPSEAELPSEPLAAVEAAAQGCVKCRLSQGRTHIVFGDGDSQASIVLIGEGPGFNEDQQGLPFVGRAGQLLNKMLQSIGLQRGEVYICNIVKCRPPDNRVPLADEVEACAPYLERQLRAIRPKLVVALGGPATQTLLRTRVGITKLRGRFHPFRDIRLLPTFHPAFLLRNPNMKRESWEDLKLMRRLIDSGFDYSQFD